MELCRRALGCIALVWTLHVVQTIPANTTYAATLFASFPPRHRCCSDILRANAIVPVRHGGIGTSEDANNRVV